MKASRMNLKSVIFEKLGTSFLIAKLEFYENINSI